MHLYGKNHEKSHLIGKYLQQMKATKRMYIKFLTPLGCLSLPWGVNDYYSKTSLETAQSNLNYMRIIHESMKQRNVPGTICVT